MTGIITVIHVRHYLHALAFLRADRFLRSPAIPSSGGGGGRDGVAAAKRSHAMTRAFWGRAKYRVIAARRKAILISTRLSNPIRRPERFQWDLIVPERSRPMQARSRIAVWRDAGASKLYCYSRMCNGLAAISTVISQREVLTLLSGTSRRCF